MSDPRTDRREAEGASHGKIRSEDDRVPSVPIAVTGIAALLIFFLASFVTISFLRMKEGDRPPLPVPQEIGQSKIGLVEQQLFESANRGAKDRDARKKQLGSYGWVDRKAGVVRIPIERAMELTAQGIRPRASAPGGAPTEAQP
jgi:hypothetical protein